MGKGSTQHQHLIQTEVPKKLLEEWLALWGTHYELGQKLKVELRPHRAGSELLELAIRGTGADPLANVVFAPIHDRKNRSINLSIKAKDHADETEAIQTMKADNAGVNTGTTNLGALLRAKLDNKTTE